MTAWLTEDGSALHYEIHGAGPGKPDLLLLPGLLGAVSSQWRPFLPALTPQFRVILLDLRGHGRSENKALHLTLDQLADDLRHFLDGLLPGPVHLSGYSLGGYLGLRLALEAPGRVSTLHLHGTKFYWSEAAVTQMRAQLDPDRMAEKVPVYADQLAQEHGAGRWRMLVRQAGDLVGLMGASGLTESQVRYVACPALVSVGDRDELVSLPEAFRLSQVLPEAGLLVLPGVRHPFASVAPIPLVPMMRHFHQPREGRP